MSNKVTLVDETEVNSQSSVQDDLGRVLEKIQEIVKKSAGADYIYRGEPECYPKVSSGLYRPFADFVIEHPDSGPVEPDVASMETAILEAAKEYLYELGSDFKVLAELQHYGCKTNLIDFTTDYLIALFFACDSSYQEDGRVILLKREAEDYQVEKPPETIKRVESQKSVLVRSLKGFIDPDDVVVIPRDLKLSVLNYLQKHHDISTKHIYKDIHGFIKWLGKYLDPNLEFAKGVIYQNRGDLASEMKEKQTWYEKAVVHYTEALKLQSDSVEAYNNRGAAYRDKGEFDRALRDFNAAIDLEPNYANAYNNRGMAYGKNGKHDLALQDFNKAINLDPRSADSYNNRGLTYKEMGEVDLAVKDYNRAVELDPEFPAAYNNRGVVYDERGELDCAIKDYDTAIELKPYYANAYNNRGMAYRDKGDVNRAIVDFSMAVQLKSDYASAYNNRGAGYSKKNQLDEAWQDFNKAIELKPDYAEAYSNRGAAYINKGKYDEGIQDFNKAIELKPDYAETYRNRGTAYFKKGEPTKAIEDYDLSIKLQPNDVEAYHIRGIAYYMKGELDKALRDFNKAIELDPNNAMVYCARSDVWLHLREWEKVKADLTFARNAGVAIITLFHNNYESVEDFEQKNGVQLPEDIAAMLTQQ